MVDGSAAPQPAVATTEGASEVPLLSSMGSVVGYEESGDDYIIYFSDGRVGRISAVCDKEYFTEPTVPQVLAGNDTT